MTSRSIGRGADLSSVRTLPNWNSIGRRILVFSCSQARCVVRWTAVLKKFSPVVPTGGVSQVVDTAWTGTHAFNREIALRIFSSGEILEPRTR